MLTLRLQREKEDLEKNLTVRRDKKKESLTRKLLEHERYAFVRPLRHVFRWADRFDRLTRAHDFYQDLAL